MAGSRCRCSIDRKKPAVAEWPDFRISEPELPTYFGNGPVNVGILTGAASNGLVDVDLDSPESVQLARRFLPPTAAIFGRAGKPSSHWLYVAVPVPPYEEFADPDGPQATAMHCELRTDAHQTVFPPSEHASGELVMWEHEGAPAHVDATEIRDAVARLAVACLLLRHWPPKGVRHEAVLAAAGLLLGGGLAVELTTDLLVAVTPVANPGVDLRAVRRDAWPAPPRSSRPARSSRAGPSSPDC